MGRSKEEHEVGRRASCWVLEVCLEGLIVSQLRLLTSVLAIVAMASGFTTAAAQRGPAQPAPADWATPSGPHRVVMEEDPGLADHTVYRPEPLGDQKLPVVAFMGPGCVFTGTAFRPFFTEVASHGFVVVATGPSTPRAGAGGNMTAKDLAATIDWAFREAANSSSIYHDKIDTTKVAVMGQSCGGLAALEFMRDARVKTLVLWNSGVLNNPATAPAVMSPSVTKESLKEIKVPIAYFVGKTDVAHPNAADDFTRIDGVPLFLGVLDIPGDAHAGTFREKNGGQFGVTAVAWLKWQLNGDRKAASLFVGNSCGLCSDPLWETKSKNLR